MLAPDDRSLLLDHLRPPPGYRLDAAVATTFTLDLTAALIPPLAFASFRISDTPDPLALLESVRAGADRIDVFCQAGQISVPAAASDLMAFLEPMVHQVPLLPNGGLFHPKIWALRYVPADDTGGAPELRLLCLSRNLTSDRSWDISLRLDAARGSRPSAANRPLAALLRHLPDRCAPVVPAHRAERVRSLADDFARAAWEYPEHVDEMIFHAFGVPGVRPAPDFSGYRHVVVAPFANAAGLGYFLPTASQATVISRAESLDAIEEGALEDIDLLVLSPLAGLGEPDTEPGPVTDLLHGLHAKLYLVERARRAHLFLGSANATDAAVYRNVEILIELSAGASKLGADVLLNADTGLRSITEPYQRGLELPDEDAAFALESLLRRLAAGTWTVTVRPAAGTHDLRIEGKELPARDGVNVTVELLTRPGRAQPLPDGPAAGVDIPGIPTVDVTPFLVVRASDAAGTACSAVICARLINDPPDRLDEVLARQVDSPEKFLRFLLLLLGLGDGALPLGPPDGSANGSTHSRSVLAGGILELVATGLAERPAALGDLDRLVTRLVSTDSGRAVLPPGFEALWASVTSARQLLGSRR